ncbi:MAG: NADH-dependent enoyl-ACP reductase InhA [Segniliparus sp.]|uniref:NADH-dependent enoyl-ACP reductase InhA n=1 Tax=Segniliparus sp. TaxID=2804064 RepID=UPI003F39D9B5
MGLLDGKTILVSGIIHDSSIAFSIAKKAQEEGAKLVLTGFGRLRLVEAIAKRLPEPAPLIELDVQNPEHLGSLADKVREHAPDGIDGAVHSIAFAPRPTFESFLGATWADVGPALEISAYSYAALAQALLPVLKEGSSLIGLDFDCSRAVPFYNWMGVAKRALESVNEYVAYNVGHQKKIRSNLVCAGPISTIAMKAIGSAEENLGKGVKDLNEGWNNRAPIGWDVEDRTPVAKTAVALLSDWLPGTTGSIIYVDGGVHSVAG